MFDLSEPHNGDRPAVDDGPPAISVENVSASYFIRSGRQGGWWGLRDVMQRGNTDMREVPAVRNVSFEVPRGTVLGVVGRNGAGKSTLLRLLAGILEPVAGRVVVRGRISPLLSVGLGMHPDLSGRENVRLGCLAFGHPSDQLPDLTASIIQFAQLGEYVEYPFRTYSSGMKARLGFAVAAHLDPEILLIDEAITGGDAKFKEKVANKMFDLCGSGRTIVIVTHGLSLVRMMATSALWMHQGKVADYGDPDDVVDAYMRYCRIDAAAMAFMEED